MGNEILILKLFFNYLPAWAMQESCVLRVGGTALTLLNFYNVHIKIGTEHAKFGSRLVDSEKNRIWLLLVVVFLVLV